MQPCTGKLLHRFSDDVKVSKRISGLDIVRNLTDQHTRTSQRGGSTAITLIRKALHIAFKACYKRLHIISSQGM